MSCCTKCILQKTCAIAAVALALLGYYRAALLVGIFAAFLAWPRRQGVAGGAPSAQTGSIQLPLLAPSAFGLGTAGLSQSSTQGAAPAVVASTDAGITGGNFNVCA